MADKNPKLHHLDLSRRRHNLEGIFESVINKIPDLCMRPAIRLANEDDYFNATPYIKLEPFKRQRVFESCISPELEARSSTPTTATPSIRSLARSRQSTPSQLNVSRSASPNLNHNEPNETQSLRKNLKVSFGLTDGQQQLNARLSNKSSRWGPNRDKCKDYSPNRMTKLELENKRKLEQRSKLLEKYTRLRGVSPTPSFLLENRLFQSSYDRLLRRKPQTPDPIAKYARKVARVSHEDNGNHDSGDNGDGGAEDYYPYANPMPECMLTDDNIDNLRDIIVSSDQIEWKMLTPVRQTSDYEERFFDKLITLHRLRYRSRLEEFSSPGSANILSKHWPFGGGSGSVFRHTRHASSVRHQSHLYDYHLGSVDREKDQVGGGEAKTPSDRLMGSSQPRAENRPPKGRSATIHLKVTTSGSPTAKNSTSRLSMGVKVRSKFNVTRRNGSAARPSRMIALGRHANQRKWSGQSTDQRIVPTLTLTPTDDDDELVVGARENVEPDVMVSDNFAADVKDAGRGSDNGNNNNNSNNDHKVTGATGLTTSAQERQKSEATNQSLANLLARSSTNNNNNTDFELSFQDDFSYENFSRFSASKSATRSKSPSLLGDKSALEQTDETTNTVNNLGANYDPLDEEEVDEIMSHLMSATSLGQR